MAAVDETGKTLPLKPRVKRKPCPAFVPDTSVLLEAERKVIDEKQKRARELREPPAPARDSNDVPIARLQNVVATSTLVYSDGTEVLKLNIQRLLLLTSRTLGMSYKRKHFPAATFRIHNPKTTLLIFPTARIVCTGGRTVEQARRSCNTLARALRDHGIPVYPGPFVVQTTVFAAWTGFPLRLVDIHRDLGLFSSYRPLKFPGLRLFGLYKGFRFTLFRSGKATMTGGRDAESTEEAWRMLYTHLLVHYEDTVHLNTSSAWYHAWQARQRVVNPNRSAGILQEVEVEDRKKFRKTSHVADSDLPS